MSLFLYTLYNIYSAIECCGGNMPKKIIYFLTLILTVLTLSACATNDHAALLDYKLKTASGETAKTLRSSFNLDPTIKGKPVKWELDTPNKEVISLNKNTVVVEPGEKEVSAILKAVYEGFYREFELTVLKHVQPSPGPSPEPNPKPNPPTPDPNPNPPTPTPDPNPNPPAPTPDPNPVPPPNVNGDPEPAAPLTPLPDLGNKLTVAASDPKFRPHSTESKLVGHKTRLKGKYIKSSNAPLMAITMLEEEVPYISVKSFFKGLDGIVDFNSHKYEYIENGHKYELIKKMEVEETKTKTIVKLIVEINKVKPESPDIANEEYTFIYEHTAQRFVIADALFLEEAFSYNEEWNQPEPAYTNLKRTKFNLTNARPLTYERNRYKIGSFQKQDDEILLPLAILSLILNSETNERATYYTGSLIYTNSLVGVGAVGHAEKDENVYVHSNKTEIPKTVTAFWWKTMAFFFNTIYGNIPYRKVANDALGKFANKLLSEKSEDVYLGIREVFKALKDLHTAEDKNVSLYANDEDPISSDFFNKFFDLLDAKQKIAKKKLYTVSQDGKTAVINLTGFDVDDEDEEGKPILGTVKQYIKAVKEIKQKYPTVENIVINMAANEGGVVAAAVDLAALIAGPGKSITYSEYHPITGQRRTSTIETKYTEQQVPRFKNYFVQTSGSTFSSGSMFTGIFRDNNLGKVIGFKTQGGASATTPVHLPSGMLAYYSSNNVYVTENKDIRTAHSEAELGIQPDFKYQINDNKQNAKKLFDATWVGSQLKAAGYIS